MSDRDHRYSIRELVQASGVPRRTIRYYVQRELLPPPRGAGRGHFYVEGHLERLSRIRDLQGQGLGLEEIRGILEGGGRKREAPLPPAVPVELVTRIPICDGVELMVSQGVTTPTPSQIRSLAQAAQRILEEGGRP